MYYMYTVRRSPAGQAVVGDTLHPLELVACFGSVTCTRKYAGIMCVLLCQIEMYMYIPREIYYNAGALAGVRGALVLFLLRDVCHQ